MATAILTPHERLYLTLFGEPENPKNWLSIEGTVALDEALNRYTKLHGKRGAEIIRLRFGLEPCAIDKEHPFGMRSYKEIGVIFDVTRERIRQIATQTLRCLRHRSYGLRQWSAKQED